MRPISYHPEAEREFEEAVDYYENQSQGLGIELADEVLGVENRIEENSETGIVWLHETRLHRVRRFPFGIVFREMKEQIIVIAVYHLSRNEDYWIHRLEDLN